MLIVAVLAAAMAVLVHLLLLLLSWVEAQNVAGVLIAKAQGTLSEDSNATGVQARDCQKGDTDLKVCHHSMLFKLTAKSVGK